MFLDKVQQTFCKILVSRVRRYKLNVETKFRGFVGGCLPDSGHLAMVKIAFGKDLGESLNSRRAEKADPSDLPVIQPFHYRRSNILIRRGRYCSVYNNFTYNGPAIQKFGDRSHAFVPANKEQLLSQKLVGAHSSYQILGCIGPVSVRWFDAGVFK